MTIATLVMYYWALASINKQEPSKVQPHLLKYLSQCETPTLRTAGVVLHARRYLEKKSLTAEHRQLAERALDLRLQQMTNKRVEAVEMTHLKLIA